MDKRRFYSRARIAGSVTWTCPSCGTLNVSRSFVGNTNVYKCAGKDCDLKAYVVLRVRVRALADADPRESFPLVPVQFVEWHADDDERLP